MRGFKAAFINEVEKLSKKKKVSVAVLLSLVLVVAGQFFVIEFRRGFGVMGASSTEFPIMILSIAVSTIVPLFTVLVTIDSFSGEFSHNTMKITLTRPITRLKLFAAKIAAVGAFILSILIFMMFFSILSGLIFNPRQFTLYNVFGIIVSYVVTLFPIMIFVLIIVFIANIFKNGISVFFVSILIFIIFKALEIVFASYSGLFFTSMFGWYKLWIMDKLPLTKIGLDFMMMISYGILLFTGGYYLFDKKDF